MKTKIPQGLRYARIGYFRSREPTRVGAARVINGTIIISYNRRKSAPAIIKYGYKFCDSYHAELGLFNHIGTEGGTVYVYRQTKNGNLALARPCKNCMRLLVDKKIRKVVYTIQDGWQMERIS